MRVCYSMRFADEKGSASAIPGISAGKRSDGGEVQGISSLIGNTDKVFDFRFGGVGFLESYDVISVADDFFKVRP